MPSPTVYEYVGVVRHKATGEETTVRLRPATFLWITPQGLRFQKDTGLPPRTRKEYGLKDHRFYNLDLSTIQQVPPFVVKGQQHVKTKPLPK